jgi:uncharacterized protein (DUF427 family)
MAKPKRIVPGPGQESVWDYPRPPRLETFDGRIRVVFNGVTIADTRRSLRVLETSHPPNYYVPRADVKINHLRKASGTSICEWKGTAIYYTVVVDGRSAVRSVWSYPAPTRAFEEIRDCLAFYPGLMDGCYVGDERVTPQPGGFYGGWITENIIGPFKGEPGTMTW